jgi:excinuclease ABC subunit C
MFPYTLPFDSAAPKWSEIPARAGVFAVFGADEIAEPYISRTPNLRRRLRRLLDPRPDQSKRLRLAERVVRIEYALTGSEFEAWLRLYDASLEAFGERARKRLHLRAPIFLRMAMENAYPRVYVTNRVTKSAAKDLFGPFPSRVAAEKFMEEMLNLFLLRRCPDDLNPDPKFPGCIYSEMKKCMAPCFKGCTDERYAEEATAVHDFLATRGENLLEKLKAERERASEAMEFEQAAELHARLTKVEAVVASIAPVVRPLAELAGVIVQAAAEPDQVALFLLAQGQLTGPETYSVVGMRHPNEQSGSSSLFAHPVAMEPVPLAEGPVVEAVSKGELDRRLESALAALRGAARSRRVGNQQIADQLCLFTRWYYRPQAKRVGEVCFLEADGAVPAKALLRMISRVYQRSVSVAAHPVEV